MEDRRKLESDRPAAGSEAAAESSREGRIRAALGVARGRLPGVESRWLYKYYQYLAAQLSLPFAAQYVGDLGRSPQTVPLLTVVALLDPAEVSGGPTEGVMCVAQSGEHRLELALVDVEVEADHPNFQFLDDYWYWFWNWRFDPGI